MPLVGCNFLPQCVPEITANEAVDARLCGMPSMPTLPTLPIPMPTPTPMAEADEDRNRLACDEATASRAAE